MTTNWVQEPSLTAAILATLLPFVAFLLIMVFTRRYPRLSAGLSIAAVSISLISAIFLLARHWHLQTPLEYTGRWLLSGDITIPFGYLLDQTSLLMLSVVATISFLVQVYSLGYMAGDAGFSRYYACMSLFAWAMMNMTLSPTMLQLYIFWELVGLSSYLLIGFWYEKFSATEAGKKAFVMTRLGDVAFFLGLLLVLVHLGDLNILEINGPQVTTRMSSTYITISALLIFGGIIGKSAQFPLLTWLPDAMEGPTPVSALLHSATMVAAGVYLFGRLFPFFSLSASAMAIFLIIGTISMLLASTMAMVTRDIKQVWAYSTISQLGFMIMGLAAGSYFGGMFHLTTHAGFKALLFLCAGVFIHSFGSNDMFDISRRGGRRLKIPTICTIIAAAALAGLPPLSGFFSKEVILGALADLNNPVWLAAGLLGAFLTAYYTFRLIFIILFPKESETESQSGHDHDHGGYWVMSWPLIVLAAITVILGFYQGALESFFNGQQAIPPAHVGQHGWLPFVAIGSALCGVVLAWLEFGRQGADQVGFVEKIAPLNNLFAERWYLDRFYRRFMDIFIYGVVSNLFDRNDKKVIDGGIDGLGKGTVEIGRFVSFLHLGMVQYRLLTIFVVMVFLGLYFFF
ncbi:NADH-ubiquinone oxidoreductase chain L (EC [Olavius sp. associated proteobacterium Delta 1]|nr:NADH-ubiquinone oxidoreductase chain L (EC [Olavius sp. associated proteobacterium Delta 1]